MKDANLAFCRRLLSLTLREVTPMTTVAERKSAWVYQHSGFRNSWEFHGPDDFYWDGTADNAYHARARGWNAWLDHLKNDARSQRMRLTGQKQRAALAQVRP